MGGTTGKRFAQWAWLLILVPAVTMCSRIEDTDRKEEPPVAGADCQQDSVFTILIRDDSNAVIDTITAGDIPLVGNIGNIPEYHDCQRFILPPAKGDQELLPERYGPLVAVWAGHALDSFPLAPRVVPGTPLNAVAVAVVHDFDTDGYPALGIRPGFNCLYLAQDAAARGGWSAKMVPIGPDFTKCDGSKAFDTLVGQRLDVFATAPTDFRPEDLPPVARWGWQEDTEKQYLSLRCGNQWCDLSDGSFRPSNSSTMASLTATDFRSIVDAPTSPGAGLNPTSAEFKRVMMLRGWNDEQRLALRDPVTNKLVPSDITGIAFPHPGLDRLSKLSLASAPGPVTPGMWVPSAYIYLSADYPGKLHLSKGWNRIWLCQGSSIECGVTGTIPTCPSGSATSWAKVISDAAGGEPEFHCVDQMHHSPDIPAGTVRWRWSEFDEQQWVRCPTTGCCTVN